MSKRRLPEELVPSSWSAHPSWAAYAYPALVGFHDRYRRETSRLVAAAMDEAVPVGSLRDACAELREHLHNHEAVEEQGLYPWIEARYDVDLSTQVAEHARLNEALEVVARRLTGGGDRAALRDDLVALDQCLRAHLAEEERLCVPALLAASTDELGALLG